MSVVEFSADAWQASSPGLAKGLGNRLEALTGLVQGLTDLAGSDQIGGLGADAMRSYITEVHLPIAQTLLLGVSAFQTAIGVYWNGYAQVDSDGNFRLVNDEFTAHMSQLDSGMSELRGYGSQLRQIAAEASHLVSLGTAGGAAADRTADDVQAMHQTVKTLKETWAAYEATDHGFTRVKEIISEAQSILKNVGNLTVGQGRQYRSGSFNLTLGRLGELSQGLYEYCESNSAVAAEGWETLFAGYAEDVEAERREQALWDLLWDGLQVVGGVLIIAVGVVGTPFSAGATLALAGLGGAMVVGGVNGVVNDISVLSTGTELNLIGNASAAVGAWYDVNVAQPAADSGSWGLQALAGVGSGVGNVVSEGAQFRIRDVSEGVQAFATDPGVREQVWNQLTMTAQQVLAGDAYTIGSLVGSVVLPGVAAVKVTKPVTALAGFGKPAGAGSLPMVANLSQARSAVSVNAWVKRSERVEVPTTKPDVVPPRLTGQGVQLRADMERAVQARKLPGYDPTGGLGWDAFLDKYLTGFDVDGLPQWKWPANPPHENGFVNGVSRPSGLTRGRVIERTTFRNEDGDLVDGAFATDPGTPFEQLSLPPDRLGANTVTVQYRVLKDLPEEIRKGTIAEGFGQPGGGVQYHFPDKILDLVDAGYLEEIK